MSRLAQWWDEWKKGFHLWNHWKTELFSFKPVHVSKDAPINQHKWWRNLS